MKRLLFILFLFIGINLFAQNNTIDSLYLSLKPNVESFEFFNDLKSLENDKNRVLTNINLFSFQWVGDDPTLLLLTLNKNIRFFNKKYTWKTINGIKIPKIKEYKLKLIQDD